MSAAPLPLEVTGLSFSYGRRAVLHDVAIQVRPGELTMLLGANGCGKSTLLKCLLGIVRPAAGQVRIGTEDVLRMAPRARARRLAYVPQSTHVEDNGLTVFDIVGAGRMHPTATGSAAHTEVLLILERLDLLDRALDPLSTLSGGERQRALIGRALAQRTPYLVLDEPVSALDLRHQVEILDLLSALAHAEGTGVLAVVHDVNLAAAYADTVLVMAGGRTVSAGPPHQTLTQALVESVYGTPVEVHQLGGRTVVLPRRSAGEKALVGTNDNTEERP